MRRACERMSLVLVSICVFVISQCSDNTLAPFQPEVTSATDNFQLQATDVRNRSGTLDYSWENTGTRAKVNHSTTTTSGSARLIIVEAGDVQVYERTLVPSLADTTSIGTPGTWTIRLVLNQYSGTLNFRVQKL